MDEGKRTKKSSRDIVDEKIKELEKLISGSKYNKRTQHAIGLYKARLAALREKRESKSSKKSQSSGFAVKKSGDASVVLIGFPSVGKSSLLNALTGTNSEVGAYAFTTLSVIPGLLKYKGAQIQILDVPGIIEGASKGSGRGKEVLQVVRASDLVLIIVDVFTVNSIKVLKKEIFNVNVRLNQNKKDIIIKKTQRGGLSIATNGDVGLNEEQIRDILKEFRIMNADVLIREPITADDLIDTILGNRVYIPSATVINKIDMIDNASLKDIQKKYNPDLMVSVRMKKNLEELKELIFQKLNLMPIFTKEAGKKADLDEPLILKKGSTVEDVCNKLHKDFVRNFRFARIWGMSAKFAGQKLSLKHKLKPNDIVEIHVK